MSGIKYLLDTNIILYILSGNETLANHLHQKSLYASFISEIELFSFKGLTAKEEKSIRAFLSHFRIINIDETIKQEAILHRKHTH
jgi:predicted nucleic acid-binding protein